MNETIPIEVFRKNDDGYSSLGIAFCIISAATPFCIYDYSTFLSFVCMMGVLCANYNSSFYSSKTDIILRRPLNTSFYASGFSSLAILSDFGGMYLLSPFSILAAAVVFTPLMYCLVAIAFLAFLSLSFALLPGKGYCIGVNRRNRLSGRAEATETEHES